MQDPLSRVDLNLLVAFQVLMQEKNVTRAAERLFVTQPAMSKTLNRLRNLLKDDLFTRSPHGLVPTTKSLELEEPINNIISQLTGLMFNATEFDPISASSTISIATHGTSSSISLPIFLNKLRAVAPKIFVICQNIDRRYQERLRSGNLDFAIVAKAKTSNEFISHKLMNIKPMLYMRKDHPLANNEIITMEERREYQHIAVFFPNFESTKADISKLFASFGISSNVPFLSANVIIALEAMKDSNILMIASDRLAKSQIINEHFVSKPLVDVINLRIDTVSLVQHVRTKNSALHQYLAKMIIDSFADKTSDTALETLPNENVNSI